MFQSGEATFKGKNMLPIARIFFPMRIDTVNSEIFARVLFSHMRSIVKI